MDPSAVGAGPRFAGWLDEAERLDVGVYAAIARTPTPTIDRAMSRLSRAADYSRLSLGSAAVLALVGGGGGRRAAAIGLASVAVTATAANLLAKPLHRRRRPDRVAQEVPVARHVSMPVSSSFPSGHSAAAFAYSRVHTGVHYPGDVVIGSLLGTAIAQATAHALDGRLR
jgi:membrane-associated phospholipid phosphatase